MQRDSYRFHIGLFDKLRTIHKPLVGLVQRRLCVNLLRMAKRKKKHQKFVKKLERQKISIKKKVQQQYAAIEKRGQIKDKYPQHLHVEIFFVRFRMNATHIRCGSIHDYLASLWRSISMSCAKIKKQRCDDTERACIAIFCSFFPQMRIRREKKKTN